jgi:Family of unknown function (DUF5675)
MELELLRSYFDNGTNGKLMHDGLALCSTIELPWKKNANRVSCIPEGRYEIIKRYSSKFKWHLQVCEVPERDCILIHPANDAIKELKGCIAPVSTITGEGKGNKSRLVFEKLKAFIFPVLEKKEKIFITIKKETTCKR